MRRSARLALAIIFLMSLSARAQKKSLAKIRRSVRRSAWVERTLARMTLREKIGQMLMLYYFGRFNSTESPEYQEMLDEIDDNHIGGVIIGTTRGPLGIERSQVYPTAVILNEFQRRAKVPLLVGADFEAGTGQRLDEGTNFPAAMAVAAANDPRLAYQEGRTVAREARAAGVQWIFAPVADVNNNPANPIINTRSFGEDPATVSEFVENFIRGAQDNGAMATAKHFPGHGNVSVDSHLTLPVVPGDRNELEHVELVPFRAAIAAGVDSIMIAHLDVPAFEPDPNVPATLSHNIMTGLLRDELGFKGLIITDAMDMGGVTTLYPPGEAAVRSVEGGADVLLMPPVPDAAMEALERAVETGRISEKRIDESVRRILEAKERLGLAKDRFVNVPSLNEKFALPEYEEASQQIADRGVTLLRNSDNLVPLDATKPMRVLLVSLSADPDPYPGETLEPAIRWRVDSLTALRADTQYSPVSDLKLPPPDTYDVAVAALFVRVADRKGNVAFPDDERNFVDQMLATGKPTVILGFGSPYLVGRFPSAKTWIAEFSTNDVAQKAAARALFGQAALGGQFPVAVPDLVPRGAGLKLAANPMTVQPAPPSMLRRLQPVYDRLDRAVADDAFPGGVVAVGWHDQVAIHPFGKLSRGAKWRKVKADTMYDMASVTKVIVTTTSAEILWEQNRLDLDAPVSRYLPEFPGAAQLDPDPAWRSRITVRNLMLHDAGLPATVQFFKESSGYDTIVARALATPLEYEPGTRVVYSDLSIILLGEIVHRLTGQTLDVFAKQDIFGPLGMGRSMFNPPRNLRPNIAPTEDDTTYRHRLVWGEVHDENAWAMGGVAGHAGLFSDAGDLSILAQMMLNGGIYAHRRLLNRSTIEMFTRRDDIGNSARALGWDVVVEPGSSAGKYFSQEAYGHLGFTGTSIWIDPTKDLFVILLTNRVNPTRKNEKIREVRPALHNAVCEALGLTGNSQ
jgi:beta-N-acetylhexosaminidase